MKTKRTVTFSCACGEKIRLTGNEIGIKKAFEWWAKSHQGDGHQVKTRAKGVTNEK